MTNTKYTPGPWAWAFEPTINRYVVRAGFAGERNICSSYGAGLKSYEAEANAELIAQAWQIPDLRVQIATLTEEIERLRECIKALNAIIAKHIGDEARAALQPKEGEG
jgi:hypothetical protein